MEFFHFLGRARGSVRFGKPRLNPVLIKWCKKLDLAFNKEKIPIIYLLQGYGYLLFIYHISEYGDYVITLFNLF